MKNGFAFLRAGALVMILCASLLLSACGGEQPTDAEATPEETPTATVEVTETPEVTATPTPTATPEPTPEEPEKDDLTGNLVPEKDATLEGVTAIEETAWENIWSGAYALTDGYEGQAFAFTPQAGMSYCSASYNICPLITEEGEYEVSFRLKFVGNLDTMPAKPAGIVIRGGKGYTNSFIQEQASGNSYVRLNYQLDGELGEWQLVTFLFTVEEDDIDADAIWRVCLEQIDPSVTSFLIDNFCVRIAE